MKSLRSFFTRPRSGGSTRFDRYYGIVIRQGVGYPTADEARRDLVRYDSANQPYGWMR